MKGPQRTTADEEEMGRGRKPERETGEKIILNMLGEVHDKPEPIRTTALCTAVHQGQERAAHLLLDRGANPSLAGTDGITPLMAAAAKSFLRLLRMLIEFKAELNAAAPDGRTAFHIVCFNGDVDCVEVLVRAGCDTSLRDGHGMTGRDYAQEYGHTAVVELLATPNRKPRGPEPEAFGRWRPDPAPEPAPAEPEPEPEPEAFGLAPPAGLLKPSAKGVEGVPAAQQKIRQFCGVCGAASEDVARQQLDSAGWDVQRAVDKFVAAQAAEEERRKLQEEELAAAKLTQAGPSIAPEDAGPASAQAAGVPDGAAPNAAAGAAAGEAAAAGDESAAGWAPIGNGRADRMQAPVVKLSLKLIDTYNHINQVYYEKQQAKGKRNEWDDKNYNYTIVEGDTVDNGRYRLIKVIGAGSFGQVVKAIDMGVGGGLEGEGNMEVAIKVIKSKPAFHRQAKMEVELLEYLNSLDPASFGGMDPNIVHLKAHFVHKGHMCLVFELLSYNLYDLLRLTKFRGVSLNLVRKFAKQVIASLMVLAEVIPTPSHVLDRIPLIFPSRGFPFFARFHRLDEAVPTSRKPEPRAEKQPARVSKQQKIPFLRSG